MQQINDMPSVFKSMSLHLIDVMKQQKASSFYDAVTEYFHQIKFEYTSEEMIDIMSEISVVTKYIKMYFVDECVRRMVDAGISVTVSGNGWGSYVGTDGKMPVILGDNGILYEKQLEAMGNSKIVFHNQSHKSNDVSERVVNGLLNGAVVLSNCTYEDEKINKEVITYDIHHLDRLPQLVSEILVQTPKESEMNAEDYSIRPAVLKMVENCFS